MTLVECRFCGRSHPEGTQRCPVTGRPLPRRKPSPPAGSPPQEAEAPPAPPTTTGSTADDGTAGSGPDPHAAFFAAAASSPVTGPPVGARGPAQATDLALQVLPNGPTVHVTVDHPVRLGREQSPIATCCSDNVSRHHADVRAEADRVTITDVGSTNGTYVNNDQITPYEPHPLVAGDGIRLGNDPPLRLQAVPATNP